MNIIICPVRSGLEMTREAVESFYAQDCGDIYISIIDNSGHCLAGQLGLSERYGVAIPTEPMGVAQSWNTMIRATFDDTRIEHVLVCNNDIILRPDAYRLLLEDGGGFVTCVGDANRDAIWGEPRPLDKRPHPDFACFLIRKWVWEKVGPFDENFKGAYFEDNDYHMRLHQARVDAHCIGVPFYHRVNGTKKHLSPEEVAAIDEQACRNGTYFFEKWGCLPADEKYNAFFREQPINHTNVPPAKLIRDISDKWKDAFTYLRESGD